MHISAKVAAVSVLFLVIKDYITNRCNKSMPQSVVLDQVAAMLGSWYERAVNGLEAIYFGMDLGSNFVWTLPISNEFTVFLCASHSLHTAEH